MMKTEVTISGHTEVMSIGEFSYTLRHEVPSGPLHRPFWLENADGEGMELTEQALFDMVDAYFREHF